MTDSPPNAAQRLLSKFLAYSLLKRARSYRQTRPQMAVFAHDFIGNEINVYGRYEDRELTALSKLITGVDRAKQALDVGANIGNHTLYFVQEGFAHIHAFEPNPRTYRLLQFNSERYPQVDIHPFGLSNRDAILEAMIPPTNAGGATLQERHQNGHTGMETVTFELRRFDNLPLAREPVGLLKIDVEGHEPEVLSGMAGMLRRDMPVVVFECNRRTERESVDQMIDLLREAGYNSFQAIEPPASIIPQWVPGALRRPLRLLEHLVLPQLAHCEIKRITEFETRNYPMIVASRSDHR